MTAAHLHGNGTIVIEKVDRGVFEYAMHDDDLAVQGGTSLRH
jgi:hypothetical protein